MATAPLDPQAPAAPPSLPRGHIYDETGRVICKFPPFPIAPTGVKIKSFEEFQPCGIQIRFDEEDELDGLGNPTVRLLKQHDNESASKKKKKNVKTMATGETIIKASTWWENWEAGEAQRIASAKRIDPNIHAIDRLALAVEGFVRSHHLQDDIELQRPWDKFFQPFLGCTDGLIQPRLKRNIQEDEEDEDEEDIIAPNKFSKVSQDGSSTYHADAVALMNQSPFESDESFAARVRRKKLEREFLSQTFLDDAHKAIKIGLSSYVFELGMYSEPKALQRVPRLVSFFLSYLIGTRALREHDASLRLAVEVAQQAITQLPLTGHIGYNIPDTFSKGLTEIFGSQKRPIMWDPASDLIGMDVDKDKATTDANDPAAAEDANGADMPFGIESVNDGGWGSAEGTGGWNDAEGGGGWGEPASASGWGMKMDMDPSTAWESFTSQWITSHNLMILLGPTTLPLTHEIGYVEESTRAISRIIMPSEVASQLKTKTKGGPTALKDPLDTLARIELKPYEHFAQPDGPNAIVQKPELLKDPYSSSTISEAPKHHAEKDVITILVEPSWMREEMKKSIGIGLKGIFVQLVPKSSGESRSGASKDGKKGAMKDDGGRVLWYAEKLHMVIPSFWTELGEYDKLFKQPAK